MSQSALDRHCGNESLSERLTNFVLGLSWRKAPDAVVENAKLAIMDCIGVSLLASTKDIGKAINLFTTRHAAPGKCAIWGIPAAVSARDAALLNGALAHGLDFDDRNHSSTYSLAVAMAAVEEVGGSGAEVLEAFIVAREVRASMDAIFASRGEGVGPGANGWHSNGVLGPIASACAAAKVRRNRPEVLKHAIGLAAGSCGALTRDGGTLAKPFRTGQSAATGLTCVYLAEAGFTADAHAMEGERGLFDALGAIPDDLRSRMCDRLGIEFDLAAPIRGKRYASCTATHVGIEAMSRLRSARPFCADEVETIECDLKPYPLLRLAPLRGFEARFSMPFCLASAAMGRELNVDEFSDEAIENPSISELMRRIAHTPKKPNLRVTLKSGEVLEEPLRRPTNLSSRPEIEAKFLSCAADVLGIDAARSVVRMIFNLERLENIGVLTGALTPSRRSGSK